MECFKRRAVIWLLACVMPFQVLTAVYLNVVGPLHFHVVVDDDHHDQSHAHAHSHGQDQAARHHHPPEVPGVVTVHDDGMLSPAVEAEIKSGWSGTMLVALVASGAALALLKMASGVTPRREPLLQSRFLGRLERPPRTHPV